MIYRLVDSRPEQFFASTETFESRDEARARIEALPESIRDNYEPWDDGQIKSYLYGRYGVACRQAIEVQDACNFSGVVLGFARAMRDIRNYLGHYDGGWFGKLEKHPAIVLWIDKINDMMGRPAEHGGLEYYSKATDACQGIVKEHTDWKAKQEAA